jgi:hypothetical protein
MMRHESVWFAGKKEGLSYRSWMACSGWIAILAAILISVVLSSDSEVKTLLGLSLAYGVQGCFAELIGVKIESSGISFPNRVFPGFPYLILFRRKLSVESFSRIDVINKKRLVIYPDRDQIHIVPSQILNRNGFVRALRNTFPTVSVKVMA